MPHPGRVFVLAAKVGPDSVHAQTPSFLEDKPRSVAVPSEANRPELAPPTFADPPFSRIVVLADDLTGACDSAAAFIRTGRTVRVWFGTAVQFSAPESVQAFTTNSTSLGPSRAARVVSDAAKALGSDPASLFFHAVDSVGRSPAGVKVLAAHRALSTHAVLFAPAFPSEGQTVRDGVLEIDDATGRHQQIRLSGLFPITERRRIAIISSPSELKPTLEAGKTILICDSETQSDLEAFARAAQDLSGLLFAGSSGLAHALAGLNFVAQSQALVPSAEHTLLVAGSSHPLTKLQLQALDRDRFSGARIVEIGLPFAAGARIRSAFRASTPQAVILAGGETALLAVHALGAHSFILQGELTPGIPWGFIQGGMAHGCVVFSKSAAFGSETVFNEILSALQRPAST